jgi:Spy/CpxP family protein refolding chaperone
MKLNHAVFSLLLLWAFAALGAQQPHADPLAENLFLPELVMQHQSDIGLTDEQRDALMSEIQNAQQRFAGLQERLQKEVEAMAVLLKKESTDQPAALAQFDKVLDRERELKRAHLDLLLRLKGRLTRAQVARLREIKNKIASGQLRSLEEVQRTLQTKLQSVQKGVERWQGEGRDPSPVAEIMQEFDSLMKTGKHKEAEALLDRALNLLRGPEKDGPEKEPKKSSAAPPSVSNRFAAAAITRAALETEIKALQPARVPWRDIAWKSCLLDGLKESCAQGKPLLLWIFIDRPADDARC